MALAGLATHSGQQCVADNEDREEREVRKETLSLSRNRLRTALVRVGGLLGGPEEEGRAALEGGQQRCPAICGNRRGLSAEARPSSTLPVRHSCVRTGDDEARRLSSPHSTLRIDHSPRPPSPHPCSDSECEPKKQPPTRLVRPILTQTRRAAAAISICGTVLQLRPSP